MYKGEGNGGGGTSTFNNSIKRKKSRVTHSSLFPMHTWGIHVNKLVY